MQNVLNNQNKLTNKVGLHQFSKNHFARDNQQERRANKPESSTTNTPSIQEKSFLDNDRVWSLLKSGELSRNDLASSPGTVTKRSTQLRLPGRVPTSTSSRSVKLGSGSKNWLYAGNS